MKYECIVGENFEIPLPDDICEILNIETGDILTCEPLEQCQGLSLRRYENQSLTDKEIIIAGNLIRVMKNLIE